MRKPPTCPYCDYPGTLRGDVAWCAKCGVLMDNTGPGVWIAWKHEAHPDYLKSITTSGDR